MDALFLKIEEAEFFFDEACDFSDAIVALSKFPVAANVLARSLQQSAVENELKWREIEQMPEFKARYSDRDSARADFLREHYKN